MPKLVIFAVPSWVRLDRHHPTKVLIECLPHLAHPALADPSLEPVSPGDQSAVLDHGLVPP